jgi:DAK2 domain fusion protein YloV
LTVLSDAAAAAENAAAKDCGIVETIEAAAIAAHESVRRTPELLPILREAGVVDSGGLGLAIILDGFVAALSDTRPSPNLVSGEIAGSSVLTTAAAHLEEGLGYCTEFVIEGGANSQTALRQAMQQIGESVLVVGQPGLLRVHLHTPDPGAALTYAVRDGQISHVKIDNLDRQRQDLLSKKATTPRSPVVVVANGTGFDSLISTYGGIVVHGGQTQNPSTEELLKGIDEAPSQIVFLLPDNRNVIATAEQAARLSTRDVRVLPTVSVPQGLAALLAFNPERGRDENLAAMTDAAASVRTGEVARAARDVSIGGVSATKGQAIGIVDDVMVVAADSPEEAVVEVSNLLIAAANSDIVTLYYGHGVDYARAEECARYLRSRHPSLDIQVVHGGQPNYDYVLSVE